jgi:Zn-dependent protease
MNTQSTPYRVLLTVLGIPFTVNGQSWQFVPPKLVIGIIVALIAKTGSSVFECVGWGIVYGLLLVTLLCLHILGHILASKLTSPPMSEARITPVLIQTLYPDNANTSGRTHLIRSLGGPIMTVLLGLISLVVWTMLGNHVLLFFALANFAIALIVLLPLPTVDGDVIWREVGQWAKSRIERC